MMSLLVVTAVFSLLIIVHEWGHFFVARRLGVRVERFSIGFGPRLWSWRRGETEYCLSLFPLGGYVKLAGEQAEDKRIGASWEFLSQSIPRRAAIILAGPALNGVLAWLAFITVFLLGYPALSPVVGEILPEKPAAQSGLQLGDRIVRINAAPIATWDDVVQRIHGLAGRPTQLVVERAGEQLTWTLTPERHEIRDVLGRRHSVGLLGIVPQGDVVYLRYGLWRASLEGTKRLATVTALTCRALWLVLTGGLSVQESLTGPIGLFVLTGEAAQLGLVYVIHLMAILSLSLAIFNLLPIPVLDGGHFLFLLIERLRGKPVSLRVRSAATQVGTALLMVLMAVVFYSDWQKFELTEKVTQWWRGNGATHSVSEEHPTP